jgi:hypothetical protein
VALRQKARLLSRAFDQAGVGIAVASVHGMLKLLGSIALARLLGFGIVGFLVIYLLLTLLS